MIPLFKDEMFPNKFIAVELPTKRQIFARTGQRAVTPAGMFTDDEPCRFFSSKTESAEAFARAAEAYEAPAQEPKTDKK